MKLSFFRLLLLCFLLILFPYTSFSQNEEWDSEFDEFEFEGIAPAAAAAPEDDYDEVVVDVEDALDDSVPNEDVLREIADWRDYEDEEEFEGFPVDTPAPVRKPKPKQTPIPARPKKKPAGPRSWTIELCFLGLYAVYAVFFVLGRSKCQKVAQQWYETLEPLLKPQFSKPGELVKLKQNEFSIKSTGRNNCHGMEAVLSLAREQDLYTKLYNLIAPAKESVTFSVPLHKNDGLIFSVSKNSSLKDLRSSHTDLVEFTREINVPDLPETMTFLCESSETIDNLLTKEVLYTLKKHEDIFEYIYSTDQSTVPNYKHMLVMKIKRTEEDTSLLVRMCLHFIDVCANFKLSKQARADIDKNRRRVRTLKYKDSHSKRQEIAQQKKLEKLKKRKETMSEEQLARRKELEQQRRLRKRGGKMKVVLA